MTAFSALSRCSGSTYSPSHHILDPPNLKLILKQVCVGVCNVGIHTTDESPTTEAGKLQRS